MFEKRSHQIFGKKISYLEFKAPSKITIVILPGGISTSSVLYRYAKFFHNRYRLICIDYPGRGDSDEVEDYSLQNISKYVSELLNVLKVNNYYLIGFSVGSSIAIESFKKLKTKPSRLCLINPGEYINPFFKKVFKLLMYFAYIYYPIGYIYKILLNYFDILDTTQINAKNYKSHIKTTLGILNYRMLVENLEIIYTSTDVVNSLKDSVIDKNSLWKIKLLIKHQKVHSLHSNHLFDNKKSHIEVGRLFYCLFRSNDVTYKKLNNGK